MKYIKLRIAGMMHYYAKQNTVSRASSGVLYETETHPTRSMLVGLIGAAKGIKRKSPELTELHDNLNLSYEVVKAHHAIFRDFQTARPEKGYRFATVGGDMKKEGEGLIKRVEYLCDAEFNVYVGCNDEQWLVDLHKAFRNPVYPLCIGKQCCSFSEPIVSCDLELLDEEDLKNVRNINI